METISSLLSVKSWLEALIQQDKIQLKAPKQDDKTDTYVLVPPAVHIGFVPPKTQLNDDTNVRIPCLVVGTSEVDDDVDNTLLNLRITAAIYDPGAQTIEDGQGLLQLKANFDGYVTLMNLLDRVKMWIRRDDGMAGRFHLESSIKLTTYEEQPWPYWYGAVEVTVSEQPDPTTRYSEALN